MPTAVTETIAAEVVTRLGTITTGNSYSFNVARVDRTSRNAKGWRPKHLGIVVDQKGPTRNEEQDHPGNPPAMGFDVVYEITGFILLSDELRTTSDTDTNDMEMAIRKAVAENSSWHNWDGNAINSRWEDSEHIEEADYAGVTVPLRVTYRVSETDPYVARA